MAPEPEEYANSTNQCPNCKSSDVKYKYLNNNKADQPRYKCKKCGTMFTLGYHNRPKPGRYKKERNKDPDELQGLRTQCPHCHAVDKSLFKYYNNNNTNQARFYCLSCKLQFQMRLEGGALVAARSKAGKNKQGKNAPRSPDQATTSACDNGEGSLGQTDQFLDIEYETLFEESVPMEQSYGGECSYQAEGMEVTAVVHSHAPNEHAACTNDYDATYDTGPSDQSFSPSDHAFFEAPADPLHQSGYDHGQYSFANELNDVLNAEQEVGDQAFFNAYFVPEDQSEYAGQCSVANECDVLYGVQEVADQFSNTYFVPEDQSEYVGPHLSTCDHNVPNAGQADQSTNRYSVPVEHSDGSQCPNYSEEMAAAAAITFSDPNNDAMLHADDFEDDLGEFRMEEDEVSLWD